jgi:hypothetical protein
VREGQLQKSIESQHARLDVLANEIRAVGTTNADAVAELRCELHETCFPLQKRLSAYSGSVPGCSATSEPHATAIAEIQGQLKSLVVDNAKAIKTSAMLKLHAEDIAELQGCVQVLSATAGGSSYDEAASPEIELSSVLRKVCSQFSTLQEKVEDGVMMSISQLEQQLPEALRQVERLSSESADQAIKVEEHEVHLGIALSRQSTSDQKIQQCMDRVEQLPNVSYLRALCGEELATRLAEANLDTLARRLELTMDAVAELGETVHQHHSQVVRDADSLDRKVEVGSDLSTPCLA